MLWSSKLCTKIAFHVQLAKKGRSRKIAIDHRWRTFGFAVPPISFHWHPCLHKYWFRLKPAGYCFCLCWRFVLLIVTLPVATMSCSSQKRWAELHYDDDVNFLALAIDGQTHSQWFCWPHRSNFVFFFFSKEMMCWQPINFMEWQAGGKIA